MQAYNGRDTSMCKVLPERYLACYPNHVELVGTSPGA